jgi:hypothetical protein
MTKEQLALVNQHSTNEELLENLPELCKTGKPFIYYVGEPTTGKDGQDYVPLFIAQQASVNGQVTEVEKMFLGWDIPLLRIIQNTKPEIAEAMGYVQGHVFDNLNIQVQDKFTPQYEGQEPKQFGAKTPEREGEIITHGGQTVYRHENLVVGKPEHIVLKADASSPETLEVTQVDDDDDDLESLM